MEEKEVESEDETTSDSVELVEVKFPPFNPPQRKYLSFIINLILGQVRNKVKAYKLKRKINLD